MEALHHLGEWGDFLGPASQASRGVFVIFERFHLNHQIAFPASDISEIEDDIRKFNLKTVLLTISPKNVYNRLLHRYSGNTALAGQQLDSYLEEQDKYITLSKASNIETEMILTDDMNWNDIAVNALNFMGHSNESVSKHK